MYEALVRKATTGDDGDDKESSNRANNGTYKKYCSVLSTDEKLLRPEHGRKTADEEMDAAKMIVQPYGAAAVLSFFMDPIIISATDTNDYDSAISGKVSSMKSLAKSIARDKDILVAARDAIFSDNVDDDIMWDIAANFIISFS